MPVPSTLYRHRYLIGLGSNLGDRAAYLARAVTRIIDDLGPVDACSLIFDTEPVGAADQAFLNAALVCASNLEPDAALAALLAIEAALGRVRQERWGNRVIDLDVLLWLPADALGLETREHASATLTVPHPHLLLRAFALVPAATVAPGWRLPHGVTLQDELATLGYGLAASAFELKY